MKTDIKKRTPSKGINLQIKDEKEISRQNTVFEQHSDAEFILFLLFLVGFDLIKNEIDHCFVWAVATASTCLVRGEDKQTMINGCVLIVS